MVITVSRVNGDGSVLTRSVDTEGREDSERWTDLAERAALHTPPPYRPEPGESVYRIQAGGLSVMTAEQDLQGALRELSIAVLVEGDTRPD